MGARGSRAYVGSNNGKITTVVTAFCDNNDNSIIDVQRHRELSGVSPAPSPPEEFSDVIPAPGPSGAAPLIAGGLDPKIQVMIDILEMSVMLRRAFPKVRRLALIETLRRCPTVDDAVNLLLLNLLNLKSSAYMSSATKVLLAQRVRDHDWTFLQQKFVLTSSQPTNESVESDFDKCRYMLACIFSCSRTMQTLASARRRRIGMTIHSCTDMEHFLELVMHSLVTSGAFTEASWHPISLPKQLARKKRAPPRAKSMSQSARCMENMEAPIKLQEKCILCATRATPPEPLTLPVGQGDCHSKLT